MSRYYGNRHLRNKRTGEERIVTREEYMEAAHKAGFRTEVTRFETEEIEGFIGEYALAPPLTNAEKEVSQ
mgnify:CR=1 FL=1